jgi:damage-control phosphatase, subfamily I
MGPEGSVNHSALRFAMWKVLSEPFHGIAEDLRSAAETADKILYLADNAGELVFDWPLIEQLGPEHVTVAVRGHAVLNDATLEDAKAAGLDQWVEVVGNGSDAPGTVLEDCSPSFQRRFHEADLIIAKGPGNFEALSDEPAKIFFLFKVRCSVISGRIGLPIGTHVLLRPGIAAVKGVFNHAQA